MRYGILFAALFSLSCRSGGEPNAPETPEQTAAPAPAETSEVAPEPPPRPTILVSVPYPGTNPMDVERTVTARLEHVLMPLEGLETMRSVSREGLSEVRLTFDADVEPFDAAERARGALAEEAFSLPVYAEVPLIRIDQMQSPIATVVVAGDLLSHSQLAERAGTIGRAIETIAGVARVDVLGAVDDEIEVSLNRAALLAFQVAPVDVVDALRMSWAGLAAVPLGHVGENGEILVRAAPRPDISTLESTIVRRGAVPVFVKDVATIRLGPERSATVVKYGNASAVALDVYVRPDTLPSTIIDGVREAARGATVLPWSVGEPVIVAISVPDADDSFASAVTTFADRIPGNALVLAGRSGEPNHAEVRLWRSDGDMDTQSVDEVLRDAPAGFLARRRPTAHLREEIVICSTVHDVAGSIADELTTALADVPEVDWVVRINSQPRPELRTSLDRRALATLGIPITDLYATLRMMGGGTPVGEAVVRIASPPADIAEWILPLRDTVGVVREVPLSAVATFTSERMPSALDRYDGMPAVFVEVAIREDSDTAAAQLAIEQAIEGVDLPSGTTVLWLSRDH